MLSYHIITSHFYLQRFTASAVYRRAYAFCTLKSSKYFLWTYSLLKGRHATPFFNTVHSFRWNNIWQVLEIHTDPWVFLAFVPFGSSMVIVSFSFFSVTLMCCLALCGGAWACSISGVYRGLNCFLRDSGYFCKRCLIRGIAAEPSNSKLCRVQRHWSETGYFSHLPCTAGSPFPPSWSPRCRYLVGAVPRTGLHPSCCGPLPPAMLSHCPVCGAGVRTAVSDVTGRLWLSSCRGATRGAAEVCCCSCRLCALHTCLRLTRKVSQSCSS